MLQFITPEMRRLREAMRPFPLLASQWLMSVALAASLAVAGEQPSPKAAKAASIRLQEVSGKRSDPLSAAGAKAIVFIFVSIDCPVSNSYAPKLRRISELFVPKGVVLRLVYPNPDEREAKIKKHLKEYELPFTAYRDPRHELTRAADVRVTPEAAVYVPGKVGCIMAALIIVPSNSTERGPPTQVAGAGRRAGGDSVKVLDARHRLLHFRAAMSKNTPARSAGSSSRLSVKKRISASSRRLLIIGIAALILLAVAAGVVIQHRSRSLKAPEPVYVPQPTGTLTFNRHVAPIIFANCSSCHRPGQSAPFTLLSYAEVKKHAADIARVTASRYMPPWLPEHGYGEFAGERRLSAEQLGIIQQWAKEGAPEGNPADLPPIPQWTSDWPSAPDLIVRPEPTPSRRMAGRY
jgi:hypothetical protein